LTNLLEQFRREEVWLGGILPDIVVGKPPVTSSEADVARILDGLNTVLERR